jgi:REP element-mobilizing transposase RayT
LRFLETLGQACDRYGLVVHGYCLMPNHYHLLVQTPRGNLSQAIGWLQVTYSVRFNRRHGRGGHLFQGRFEAHLIGADDYARQLVRYVHLNPVRPRDRRKPVPADRLEFFEAYRWSSHRAYAGTTAEVPAWLCLEWLSYWLGSSPGRTTAAARRQYRRDIRGAFGEKIVSPLTELRGGLVLGGEALWNKAQAILGSVRDADASRWLRRQGMTQTRARVAGLLAGEEDRRVQIWARVTLGGERMSDLAGEFGYSDGSGILRVVQRLEARSQREKGLAAKLSRMRREMPE